ncbi:peptide chain release factor 3 [Geminisphaera colitermitum]|uniref:peptide chain release factor 3 n=1 Tax=Geminisphaera colitermitum TaxID=1148786 RepID=UPI000158CAC1|nr:peptide chain release factor 3 [Geminisphaera colitermitum]
MTSSQEIARRRTFAIISHPDAGKTTLTEKFLLYGNAIHLAGTVTARKNQRATTSDWMELEKQRGISVSSTVLQFDYQGYAVNLLDTPGHKDFSEDTYRVLTAVDAALMVIDAGKGIEPQTRKLFEVCRRRGVPIMTFINKCDRPTLNPIDLIDELERVLGLSPCPLTWPLGNGPSFRGVYDRRSKQVHLFERVPNGAYQAPVQVTGLDDPAVRAKLDDHTYAEAAEQIEMLDGASAPFDLAAIHAGKQTPVFFGSAINNFGVGLLLEGFLKNSIPPTTRRSVTVSVPGLPTPTDAREIPVTHDKFSGFVFKIQANMDPKHRDRIAFIRVCSGKFTRDMVVTHQRTGKNVRLSSSHKLFGQDRETVDEAWPGDVIGLVGHSEFGIGDTLTEDRSIAYDEIPRFPSEVFAYISNPVSADAKKYRAGLEQLLQEGVVQSFQPRNAPPGSTLLAAVGPLQFEVVQYRLKSEYNADSRLETTPWTMMRWIEPHPALENPNAIIVASGVSFGVDKFDHPIVLFPNDWSMHYFVEKNPELILHEMPIEQTR